MSFRLPCLVSLGAVPSSESCRTSLPARPAPVSCAHLAALCAHRPALYTRPYPLPAQVASFARLFPRIYVAAA